MDESRKEILDANGSAMNTIQYIVQTQKDHDDRERT